MMGERKILLAAEAFSLMSRITNTPELWTQPRIKTIVRILERYLRRYHNLSDEERDVYEARLAAAKEQGDENTRANN